MSRIKSGGNALGCPVPAQEGALPHTCAAIGTVTYCVAERLLQGVAERL